VLDFDNKIKHIGFSFKIEMRQQLLKIKMQKGGNPGILFDSLTV
jgi:hypothetical protein